MAGGGAILVTGGSGFVGGLLLPALAAAYPARQIVNVSAQRAPVAIGSVRAIPMDLATGDIDGLVAETAPDLVLHLAARSSVQQSLDQAGFVFEDNLRSGLRLIDALRRRAPAAGFLFASSGEVYGRAFATHPIASEEAPIGPANAYARSKAALEFAVLDLMGGTAPAMILRLFNHFGPGQDHRFVVPAFAAQLGGIAVGRREPVVKVGNLDAERDFLPVADVIEAYLRAIDRLMMRSSGVELFNVASGQARRIRSVLDELIALSGLDVRVEIDPTRLRPSEIPKAVGDASAFAAATGWQPRADWRAALSETYASWRDRAVET